MTKLIVAFRNFANAPKTVTISVFSNVDTVITLGISSSEITLIPIIVVWLFYRYCLFNFSMSLSLRKTRVKFVV
jgi:hypothetical protein